MALALRCSETLICAPTYNEIESIGLLLDVECMYLQLQNESADDYVIGTGESHSIREFCEIAGLDWQDHLIVDDKLIRKIESYHTTADSSKVRARLGSAPENLVPGNCEFNGRPTHPLLSGQLSSSDSRRRIS